MNVLEKMNFRLESRNAPGRATIKANASERSAWAKVKAAVLRMPEKSMLFFPETKAKDIALKYVAAKKLTIETNKISPATETVR